VFVAIQLFICEVAHAVPSMNSLMLMGKIRLLHFAR